jgi:hypothetical protein
MNIKMKKVDFLRKKYPCFVYHSLEAKLVKDGLKIVFDFRIEPNPAPETSFRYGASIYFKPAIVIKGVSQNQFKRVGKETIKNLAFHLGLIEMLSYWKAVCSPKIIIKAGYLNKEQIKWWKDLVLKGLGQFFFENKINFTSPGFLKIVVENKDQPATKHKKRLPQNNVLLPISGGKDSLVTLEILKTTKKKLGLFSLNPTKAAQKIMKIRGGQKPIIIRRKIDEKLLELNEKGYLNGHTPFSAYLAFLSILAAVIFNYKFIAFSNEKSANEGNVKYLGKIINHQWSKSFEFEKIFRSYVKKYLAEETEYFSFLRPIYGIQVAKLFSNFLECFPVFLSCNKSSKMLNIKYQQWCGECPKCLYVYAILSPYFEEKELLKIFGKNLFENKKLLPIMKALIEEGRPKPFECVGAKIETLTAFYLNCLTYRERFSRRLPFLLRYFEKKVLPKYPGLQKESKKILNFWDKNNFLPRKFEKLLRDKLL